MRISDWSSDVCSSDLLARVGAAPPERGKAGGKVSDARNHHHGLGVQRAHRRGRGRPGNRGNDVEAGAAEPAEVVDLAGEVPTDVRKLLRAVAVLILNQQQFADAGYTPPPQPTHLPTSSQDTE